MNTSVPNRAATSSITGYAYQFDLTTLKILAANNTDRVTIEGCEDIDIDRGANQEAVQCKYLQAARYSLAGLRKPILPMLRAFTSGQHWNYRLYVYYGDSTGLPTKLTLDDLKHALTEKKQRPSRVVKHYEGVSDNVLQDFLNHFTIEPGKKFTEQQADVHAALLKALGGTTEDVKDLHYADAVATVMELAMCPEACDRVITRAEFVHRLNKRPAMYTRWHREYVGVECFQKLLKRRIKSAGLLAPDKRRLIVLQSPGPKQDDGLLKISHLIEKLGTTMQGKLATAKPWTIVLDAPEDVVTTIKKQVIAKGITFNDGFEHISFNPSLFDRDPIVNTHGSGKAIRATSYDIRIISAGNYLAHKGEIRPPAAIVSFAESLSSTYADDQNTQMLDIPGWRSEDIMNLLEAAK